MIFRIGKSLAKMVSSMLNLLSRFGSWSKNARRKPLRTTTCPESGTSLPDKIFKIDDFPLPFLATKAIFWSL